MFNLEYDNYITKNFEEILKTYKEMLVARLDDLTTERLAAEKIEDLAFIKTFNEDLYTLSLLILKEKDARETNQDEIPS